MDKILNILKEKYPELSEKITEYKSIGKTIKGDTRTKLINKLYKTANLSKEILNN